MGMLDYIMGIKRKLRDQYNFVPKVDDEYDPVFPEGTIPDGKYPMEVVEGMPDQVVIEDGMINCCNFKDQ